MQPQTTSNELYRCTLGGITCTCVTYASGQPHPHTNKWQPILGAPHIAVCTNCGNKVLISTLGGK